MSPQKKQDVDVLRKRLSGVAESVQKSLVDRDDVVEYVMASLISGVPLVLFGPPGTAKSACVRMIADRCTSSNGKAGKFFEYLMTKHTMPEEIFGAADIEALLGENPEFVRNTKNMLPDADFVFLDEVFRGGGHILNTLLAAVNERVFHNGRDVMQLDLVGVIAAANEAPRSGDDLDAFFDRFPLRVWLPSVLDKSDLAEQYDNSKKLLEISLKLEAESLVRTSSSSPNGYPEDECCSTDDFRAARKHLSKMSEKKFDTKRFAEFRQVFVEIRRQYCLSDRSFATIWRFGCALDWLRTGKFGTAHDSADRLSGHYEALSLVGRDKRESGLLTDKIQNLITNDLEKSDA